MAFFSFISSIFLLATAGGVVALENDPIILVTQRVIEENDSLPISVMWYYRNWTEGDQLLVYSKHPRKIWVNRTIENYTGRYELPDTTEHNANLDQFCAVIVSKSEVFDKNPSCESKVQWMFDRRESLKDFSLMDLVIPGTHQSAAYAKSDYESLHDQNYLSRWTLCQTKSIKSQLTDGIRYLDLRPGIVYVNGTRKFTLTHKMFALITLDRAVEQINDFLDSSKDILIVSFKEFYEGFFSTSDHLSFIQDLEHSFARHAHKRQPWTTPLDTFWRSDRRLIITYLHPTYSKSKFMWPPIKHSWGNVRSIPELHTYLNSSNQRHQNISKPWAAMAELTHSSVSIIKDILLGGRSLRDWAEDVSDWIPRWYIEEWNSTANIIAVDFYQTTGITDLAIQLNEGRVRGLYSKPETHG